MTEKRGGAVFSGVPRGRAWFWPWNIKEWKIRLLWNACFFEVSGRFGCFRAKAGI
jgi:hypothetical protein